MVGGTSMAIVWRTFWPKNRSIVSFPEGQPFTHVTKLMAFAHETGLEPDPQILKVCLLYAP
jgi:hypothetical protein